MFDTDFGYGIWNSSAYQNNTLQFALAANGPGWPNPPWSTLFLRKLLENNSFKNDFINYFADLTNTNFKPENVVNKINSMASVIHPEIPKHSARWNQFTYTQWLTNVQNLRYFASHRLDYLRAYYLQKFNLTGTALVTLSNSDTTMGSIKINSLNIKTPTWNGIYFFGIPITVKAQPKTGYRFVRWEDGDTSTYDSLTITLNGALSLNAVFEIDSNYNAPNIVINEISYNPSSSFNTEDWIEIYNNGESPVNISGWVYKDSDDAHSFVIPQGTILDSNAYLVLCVDTSLFKPLFPDVDNFIGNVSFGLSGSGELIRLYDNEMNIMDSLTYDDNAPWPTQPDGNGPTLSLKNPDLDNTLGENWNSSIGYGTPGKINDTFVYVEDEDKILPTEYSLMQNYPNPFNPSTLIRFSIPKNSFVTLKIYDVIGNEIAILIDEEKSVGNYEIEFSSLKNNLKISSGVYLYQLRANDYMQTKKMILIK